MFSTDSYNTETFISRPRVTRRSFLGLIGAATAHLAAGRCLTMGNSSMIDITQLIYPGGNWQPRTTALRRLAWETHKRTAADMVLEPGSTKPLLPKMARTPLAYLSGDRPFAEFPPEWVENLNRYVMAGGTIIIDPAYSPDGDSKGFIQSVTSLLESVLPDTEPKKITSGHVIFRTFYSLDHPMGRVKGSPFLTGYKVGDRVAVTVGDHDMGGAWAKDNLGNWVYEVNPGGARQREMALRLGINLVMYALCGDYKDENPHKLFKVKNRMGS